MKTVSFTLLWLFMSILTSNLARAENRAPEYTRLMQNAETTPLCKIEGGTRKQILASYLLNLRKDYNLSIGYPGPPMNLAYVQREGALAFASPQNVSRIIDEISHFNINNAGDPFDTSGNFTSHSKYFEQSILRYAAELYHLGQGTYWGYVLSGSTEGILFGLFQGRELLKKRYPGEANNIRVMSSSDSHYAIRKSAHILGVEFSGVKSQKNGEIDYADVEHQLSELKERGALGPVIMNANIGTTMKGAIDSAQKLAQILGKYLPNDKYYIHADGAYYGAWLPLISPEKYGHVFKYAQSMNISGHKTFGTAAITGILLTTKSSHDELMRDGRANAHVQYIGSRDTTMMSSRDGRNAVLLWESIRLHGADGFKKIALNALADAAWLKKQLLQFVPSEHVTLNDDSIIVHIQYPDLKQIKNQNKRTKLQAEQKLIARKYQLAESDEAMHIMCRAMVTRKTLNQFLHDYRSFMDDYKSSQPLGQKATPIALQLPQPGP